MVSRPRVTLVALLAILAVCWTNVAGAWAADVKIPTLTIETDKFLRGLSQGKAHAISGELELPAGGSERVPAVVLLHGGGGVQDYHHIWARELRGIGFATLIVDSFSGRGLARIADNLEALSAASRVLDLYRALAVLAADPRIDRDRIVFMGFSHGATAGLYAVRRRFRKAFGPPDADYAAWLLFYPYCNTRFIDDVAVTPRPIRIFHGMADNWTPIGPCRDFVARARGADGDVAINEYPNAYHGFDNSRTAQYVRTGNAMNPSRCFFVEVEGGVVVNSETGKAMTYRDACWTRGVTTGYEPAASTDAVASVKPLLAGLTRRPGGRGEAK
jgi:dienelactone hydrolase